MIKPSICVNRRRWGADKCALSIYLFFFFSSVTPRTASSVSIHPSFPVQRVKAQPQLWHVSAEAPPWLWMVPNTSGLCRVGSAPPVLISSRPPPVIQTVSGWQMSSENLNYMHYLPSAPLEVPDSVLHFFLMRWIGIDLGGNLFFSSACLSQWEMPSRPHVLGFQPSTSVDLLPVFPHVYRTVLPPHYGKGWVEKRVPDYKFYLNNTLALETTWISPEEMGIFQRQEKPLLRTNQTALSICRPAAASRNIHTLLLTPRRVSGCPVAIKRVGSSKRIALAAAAMMVMDSDVTQGPSVSSAHPLHLLSLSPIKIPFLTAPHAGRSTKENAFISVLVLMKRIPSGRLSNAAAHLSLFCRCVVWTGDDRVFFFNPTMHLSVWEKPVDLKDRGDLNRIIEDPPHKRKKDSLGKNGSSLRMVLPLELRIGHFRDMLLERGVSAFSTWEKELHKIVFDPRYLLLSPEERKQIYDQFVKARMKEEHKEKKCKLQQAKEEYRKLLEESKITSRSMFKEFSEKYGNDPRFKQVLKRKDQELFFTQFIGTLKKRDKENRIRLRKMR
uniref:Transcription elongation regulator 1 like n=1 Tax=Sinocyclocheilus anshuiensis TaxID=1608454 RepID=A0A671PWJ6_9TELE